MPCPSVASESRHGCAPAARMLGHTYFPGGRAAVAYRPFTGARPEPAGGLQNATGPRGTSRKKRRQHNHYRFNTRRHRCRPFPQLPPVREVTRQPGRGAFPASLFPRWPEPL